MIINPDTWYYVCIWNRYHRSEYFRVIENDNVYALQHCYSEAKGHYYKGIL